MNEQEKENNLAESDSAKVFAGDVVEEAGETTASALITGPVDAKPIGADTMVKVAGESGEKENANH